MGLLGDQGFQGDRRGLVVGQTSFFRLRFPFPGIVIAVKENRFYITDFFFQDFRTSKARPFGGGFFLSVFLYVLSKILDIWSSSLLI